MNSIMAKKVYTANARRRLLSYFEVYGENFQWAKTLPHFHDFEVCTSVSSIPTIKRSHEWRQGFETQIVILLEIHQQH